MNNRRLCTLIVLFFCFFFPAKCLTGGENYFRVVKLKMQSAKAVTEILEKTFGRRLRVAEAAMINSVVISANEEGLLNQAEEIINSLDRVPSTLKYSIKMTSRDVLERFAGGLQVRGKGNVYSLSPKLEADILRGSGGEIRTIVGMEGQPVALSSQMIRLETLPTPWGPQGNTRTETRGLFVSGRLLAGGREAMVEVSYSEGGFNDSRQIQTQVVVPLQTWVCLGDLAGSNSGGGWSGTAIGASGEITRNKNSLNNQKIYFIKIDKAQ